MKKHYLAQHPAMSGIIILLVLMSSGIYAQQSTYQKSFGGSSAFEYGYAMQATNDGGCVIGGCTFSYGGGGCHKYVVKFDASGNESWSKVYNANQTEVVNDIANTSDGGYAICGYSYSGSADTNRAHIIRTNAVGDTLWSKFWRDADAYAITQSSDGNILAAGLTADNPSDAFLIKLDGNTGDTLWTRVWGGAQQDWFYGIQETNDGGIILAGYTASYGAGQNDMLLMKTDANGNALWEKTYGTAGKEEAYGHCVQQTTDGGFIVSAASTTDSTVSLIKTDASGNIQWQKHYFADSTFYSNSHAVEQTTDKGYIMEGWKVKLPAGANVPFLIKTDSLGNIMWSEDYGGSGNDVFYGVKQVGDGGYVACGDDYSFEPNGDAYMVKTDASGNSGCHQSNANFVIRNLTYTTTTINMPLYHRSQTTNTVMAVTSGYSEIPLCSTVGINNMETNGMNVTVFPNPFSYSATIQTTGDLKNATLTIYNLYGQEVKQIKNISGRTNTLHRDNLPSGLYFIRLTQDNKTFATNKLIIVDN